jgi:phenylacetate-coenzyme A ligase PaaK-like adenylate-forming protein
MGSGRHLKIRVEPANEQVPLARIDAAREYMVETVKYRVGVTPDVEVCEVGSLPRVEGKARRIVREI